MSPSPLDLANPVKWVASGVTKFCSAPAVSPVLLSLQSSPFSWADLMWMLVATTSEKPGICVSPPW